MIYITLNTTVTIIKNISRILLSNVIQNLIINVQKIIYMNLNTPFIIDFLIFYKISSPESNLFPSKYCNI